MNQPITSCRASVGWDDDSVVSAWPGFPALDGDHSADACVVGLGASGLAAVRALASRGLSVIGVDAGRVAAGAAGRNGGLLLAGPSLFLHDAIERWGSCAIDLYLETLRELQALEETVGDGVVQHTGSVRLAGIPGEPTTEEEAADRERDLADCAKHAAALREHGIAAEDYDGPLGKGVYLPDDATMNPARRALVTARAASTQAALFEQTPVLEIQPHNVRTARGAISAHIVIIAVDGTLEMLLPQLVGRVRTTRLQMVSTAPVAACLDYPVYARWGLDYAQQTTDGRLFVGGGRDRFADAEWTTDAQPTGQVQNYLDGLVQRMSGGRAVQVTHRWAASVGYTPDARPLCTLVDDGVVAIGGYNGTGNLVGPIAARAAVALALDDTTPPSYLAA